ncbi:hypothetical protein SLEP1_g37473 [Rubroshorea leprosula]|uniref:Uncharacterized protein n=1 Tax=Rubroshorea leprosula TaxID=152421 RepID=A0AAV5KV05_9ROSI|nr:hypothetical protein SLEP1_g37473 [Rubroshorea leprosula]
MELSISALRWWSVDHRVASALVNVFIGTNKEESHINQLHFSNSIYKLEQSSDSYWYGPCARMTHINQKMDCNFQLW